MSALGKSHSRQKKKESFGELVRTLVVAVLIAVGVRSFAFEPFNIPSESMLPTLMVGDYLFVSKYTYGYSHYSLPWSLPLFDGRIWASPPVRGDVAVFKLPSDPSQDYIKRIIGLPGDRIQVRKGVLYINDVAVKRERVDDFLYPLGNGRVVRIPQYRETLPNGRSYLTLDAIRGSAGDNTQVFTVPPGHYFGMGDNRDNSLDSRFDVGFIPEENLVGPARVLFMSLKKGTSMWQIWKLPFNIRYSRLFTTIQ